MIVPYRNKEGYVIIGGVSREALEQSLAESVEENERKKWTAIRIPELIYCHESDGLKHISKCAMCGNLKEFTIIGVKCNCKPRKNIPECYNKFINQIRETKKWKRIKRDSN